MEFNEVLKQVNEIFGEILENDSIILTESTTADDVEEWDSLTHIQLIVAIEKKFKNVYWNFRILSFKVL